MAKQNKHAHTRDQTCSFTATEKQSTQRYVCTQTHSLTHFLSQRLNKTAGQWILLGMRKQRKQRLTEDQKKKKCFCFFSLCILLHDSGKSTGRWMCLSFPYLLWLLSKVLGFTKPAKFLNDECIPRHPLGVETNLTSTEKGGWYCRSPGILSGTILEIFILFAWIYCPDKSLLPLWELYNCSIRDFFVWFSACLSVCLPINYSHNWFMLLLFVCSSKNFTMLACDRNETAPTLTLIWDCNRRNIFQNFRHNKKEWETTYQYRKPFLFLIRLFCNVLLSTGGITVYFFVVTNTFSLSFWTNHLSLVSERSSQEIQPSSRP